MNGHVMDAAESTALDEKQKHWARIRESIRQRESIEVPTPQPGIRSVRDYPLGQFQNLEHVRLEWVHPNWFEFIPKLKGPFAFVRSTGESIAPKNFFTDGGSIPRLFRWSDELDPFGRSQRIYYTTGNLICITARKKTFEDVASILMEALRTLMEGGYVKHDLFVFWMIETGINSWVARDAWNNMPPKCPLPPYKPE